MAVMLQRIQQERTAREDAAGSVPADRLGTNVNPGDPARGAAVRGRGRPAAGGTPDRAPPRAARRWRGIADGGPDGERPRDLLGLLMAARDADGSGLSEQEIRDEISTFLVAGHETTAMALTWALALLSACPQARRRLEDEVDTAVGEGPADPDKLPWTTAVISEAIRLYPPAWTLERTALADDDVCGTPVPAGSMIAVLPYLIHRNPAVWPNPAGFDPGRFMPGAPERHRYAWLPFGGGKRGCIGAGFAQLEAVLVLARLCRHYRLDLTGPGLPRPPRLRHTPPRRTSHHAPHPPRLVSPPVRPCLASSPPG